MEQIIVRHPDGTTALLTSRERKSGVTKAEQSITLLGADTVAITVKSATPLTFHLGDQIDVYGKTYTLNQLPGIKKNGNRSFEYTLTFEGVQYELIDVQFMLPEEAVSDSFTGDLEAFLGILVENLNRVYPEKWALGVFPSNTEYKTLTYTEKNCLEVLQDLCEQYSTEFEITQVDGVRTINIKTAGVNFPYTFRYGRTGGLYELTRQNINSKNVVTRLYVYGGSNNLGDKYRNSRLCLPGKSKNASYIEDAGAVAAYGVKENVKIFDDIFPNRIGKITATGSGVYSFVDETMNFDLNEKDENGTKWLINGASAKIHFNTGNLAGYDFDLVKYDHDTKTFTIAKFQDETKRWFPSDESEAFQFGVGDEYIITDINLPDAYVEQAEAELSEAAENYLNQYSQPQVQYGLSIDENFIRQFAGELTVVNLFAVGDYLPVEDEDVGVDKSVRITSFTRDLLQEYKYNITLGDSVTKTTITRVIEDLQKIDSVIEINDLADPSKARRNWRTSQEVLANVFDPEGHYYSEKIKPLSIETTMLATGARSQQFVLQNTRFEPNYEGNPNTVKVVGGTLVHYTIAETVKSWQLNTATFSNLVSEEAYYIYARCQKNGTVGNVVFDTTQYKVDEDPVYYYFLIGSLSSVMTDSNENRPARLIALTYGATTINGSFITTGRIASSDGATYFDLDRGQIGGRIVFSDHSSTEAGETILEGGKLNTRLIDTDRLVARHIEASDGHIADFTIQGKEIVGRDGTIVLQNDILSSLSALLSGEEDTYSIPIGSGATASAEKTSDGQNRTLTVDTITATTDVPLSDYTTHAGVLRFAVDFQVDTSLPEMGILTGESPTATCEVLQVESSGQETVIDRFSLLAGRNNHLTFINAPASYRIRTSYGATFTVDWLERPEGETQFPVLEVSASVAIVGYEGAENLSYQANTPSTRIGTDGLFSFWSPRQYLYFSKDEGFSLRSGITLTSPSGEYSLTVNDQGISIKGEAGTDASNNTVSFTMAGTRVNISTGEKLSVAFGKIARWLADLKTVAFTGKYSDLDGRPTSLPANGGNADTAKQADAATKATQDADGNKISDTYLKRSGGTMTGNLALSNEVHVNGAVGNLVGRFTWGGGLKAVVGNTQDNLALLSNGDATLNGSPIFTRAGGLVSGTLVQKKSNCSIHTDVASYRMPDNHTGWVRIDFGLLEAELLGVIDMIVYGKGGISIDFSGYTYVSSSDPTANNWYGPKYGIRGSLDAPMPRVFFAKDNTTGRRYIMIGGDGFAWGPYGFISLSKIVLGSLGNTTGDLGVSIEAVSGNYADLGLTNASVSNPSVSVEVERARKDGNGNDIPSTYATKEELSDVYVDTVPSNPKDGDILITTTD